mmetsp:Transcript_9162/g.16058  ORF Transcript_9162/g.16058 Transcript_9162/m.16058 type:complete len:88 (+) Transcript_9162:365-628(+)
MASDAADTSAHTRHVAHHTGLFTGQDRIVAWIVTIHVKLAPVPTSLFESDARYGRGLKLEYEEIEHGDENMAHRTNDTCACPGYQVL